MKLKNSMRLLFYSALYFFFCSVIYLYLDYQPFNNLINAHPEIFKSIFPGKSITTLKKYLIQLDINYFYLIFSLYIFLAIIFIIINFNKIYLFKSSENLKIFTNTKIMIFLAAFLGIFAELSIIRFHSSYFQIFAFYKNISLMSCLFGLGFGFFIPKNKNININMALYLISLQIIFFILVKNTPINAFLQNPFETQLNMGQGNVQSIVHLISVNFFLIVIFIFNAICFIPLGHAISYYMRYEKSLIAYSFDLLGGIFAIVLFFILSLFWVSPVVWFVLIFLLILFFNKNENLNFFNILLIVINIFFLNFNFDKKQIEIYSPYQVLHLKPNLKKGEMMVKSSNLFYQNIIDLSEERILNNLSLKDKKITYTIPYQYKKNVNNILILGSGTGNDVAAAVSMGINNIDAVEIDPAILHIGKIFHPEEPYKKVKIYNEDARAFLKKADKKYDIINYGRLDSHIMLSGVSGGLRIDNFVYTVEGLIDAKNRLKDNGILSLSFVVLSRELGNKIFKMLEIAFGHKPIVITHSKNITEFEEDDYTFLISKNKYYNFQKYNNSEYKTITKIFDNEKIKSDISTDNWPFFYMPKKKFPLNYTIFLLFTFLSSFLLIHSFQKLNFQTFSFASFFLGAGFMLVETKVITELALLYGTTWYVAGITIFFVLLMAFFANLIMMNNVSLNNALLLTTVSILLAMGYYFGNLNISFSLKKILMPIILTLPILISGLAFSNLIKKKNNLPNLLGANLLGAIFGGILEYGSMFLGMNYLYLIAFIIYTLAFMCIRLNR